MGRKWQGASWTPKEHSALKRDGAWCQACYKRHGYMSLGIGYDKNSKGQWVILWTCRTTGNIIEETIVNEQGGNSNGTRHDDQ